MRTPGDTPADWPPVEERILGLIDLSRMRGIEVGALHNPRLPPEHPNVFFLDHASAAELREKYAANAIMVSHMDQIVEVDYVWSPGKSLSEVVGADAPFAFLLASHVVEHIPNPIGWLQQIAAILTDGGLISLIIPDKRYCFDAKRTLTVPAQWVDAYLRSIDQPTFQQIFDHESNYLGEVDAADLWDGRDPLLLRRLDVEDPNRFAYERCLGQRDANEFIDVHCSTFIPESFIGLVQASAELDLLPLRIRSFYPTEPGSFEFYCTLERLPAALSRAESRSVQATSFETALAACHSELVRAAIPADTADYGDPGLLMQVSELERKLIAAKRRTMSQTRSVVAQVRQALVVRR